jgi:hypothetical protein
MEKNLNLTGFTSLWQIPEWLKRMKFLPVFFADMLPSANNECNCPANRPENYFRTDY